MNLKQLLEIHRVHYLEHYLRHCQRLQEEFLEVLYELSFPAPDELFRLYRADIVHITGDEPKIIEISLREPRPHAVWEGHVGEAEVEVHPFEWHACIIEALTDRFDRAAVLAWGTHWIDEEDLREKDAQGLQGVIHNISPPSYPLGKLTMKVDFGSAPVQAAIELIKVLSMGAKNAKITLRSASSMGL